MTLNFSTDEVYIVSPTYWEHYKDKNFTKDLDYPMIKMPSNITINEDVDIENDNNPLVRISILNEKWTDPKDADEQIELRIWLTKDEVIYLNKHLEAFLKNNK